jgi:hypothetical protein
MGTMVPNLQACRAPRRDVSRPGLDFWIAQATYSIKRLMDAAFGASVRVRLSATL